MPKQYKDLEKQAPNFNVFQEAWKLVYANFYDPSIRAKKWPALYKRYAPKAMRAKNQKELYDLTQEMLNKLGASHLRLMSEEIFDYDIDSETSDKNYPSFGLDIEKYPIGYFVRVVAEGSAGEKAGIQRGDQVIAINNVPVKKSKLIRPSGTGGVYRIYPRHPVLISLRRNGRRLDLLIRPTAWNRISASMVSGRVFMENGKSVCYIHLWHLANYKLMTVLKNFLNSTKRNCQALILDLRGFGGTIAYLYEFLDVLKKWGKPIVAIIDKETRSIKETIAYNLKKKKMAVLVGEKTIGSVLGSRFFDLSDGSTMIIPVLDMRHLSDGKSLEAKGVMPDIVVPNNIPYSNGQDPLLQKAIKTAFKLIS